MFVYFMNKLFYLKHNSSFFKKGRGLGEKRTDSLCMYTWKDSPKMFVRVCRFSPTKMGLQPHKTGVLASPCPLPLWVTMLQTTIKDESFI